MAYQKKERVTTVAARLCDCGNRATRRIASAWQCERCAAIVPEDFHLIRTKPQRVVRAVSANRLMMEWREGNAV